MKKLFSVFVLSIGLLAGTSQAALPTPQAGAAYRVLKTPQPLDTSPRQIAVTEFFWYGCPHCNDLDPALEAWIKRQAPDVVFKRVPLVLGARFVPHSKLFYALDALGLSQQLTPLIFHEIHENHDDLLTEQAQADFLAKNGVDPLKFKAAYESFSADNDLRRDAEMAANYQIDGVPTLAVQGKYETSPAQAGGSQAALQVLDYLVSQVRAKRM